MRSSPSSHKNPMSNFASLRTAITTKLQGISALQAVYDSFTANFSGFPAAMFEPAADPSVFADNRDNEHIYSFDLFLVQELNTQGRSTSIGTLVTAVDAVVAAFEGDDSLGGACLYSETMASGWDEVTLSDGPVKYAKITIKCHTIAPY